MPRLALLAALTLALPAAAQDKKDGPKKPNPDDQYKLGPDSKEKPGVPKGKVTEHELPDSTTYPGFSRKWWLYIPAQYDGNTPAALMVFQDGQWYQSRTGDWRVPTVFDNLIHEGTMPVTVGVFVQPGDKPGSKGRNPANRSVEYDTLSPKYVEFLLTDVLPLVEKEVKLTKDPEGRAICGASSGGICAFTAAFQRPDQFRKVLSTIGSFTNIRGGGQYPDLVRFCDRQPIRVFQQDGTGDIVNQFGSWPEANKAMAAALQEKGYDHKVVWGEGGHTSKHGASILPDALRWLWRDYKLPKE